VVVLVDHRHVACVQPAALVDRVAGCLVVVEVALHHLWPAYPQLTRFTDAQILAGGGVDDANLCVRDGDS
jgi:hypothetical protein